MLGTKIYILTYIVPTSLLGIGTYPTDNPIELGSAVLRDLVGK